MTIPSSELTKDTTVVGPKLSPLDSSPLLLQTGRVLLAPLHCALLVLFASMLGGGLPAGASEVAKLTTCFALTSCLSGPET